MSRLGAVVEAMVARGCQINIYPRGPAGTSTWPDGGVTVCRATDYCGFACLTLVEIEESGALAAIERLELALRKSISEALDP